MITFTVPEGIRLFIRSNQRIAYGALFKASSASLKKLAGDDKYIGGDLPGFFGVLHTWGRQLHYHPHIHYVAPGGAYSKQDGNWHPSRIDFYLPVRALSKIFRAKFRDLMIEAGVYDSIPPEVWKIAWNVNVQAVGNAARSIRYLSNYVFKIAISDSRIVCVEEDRVTIRYRKKGSSRMRRLTFNAMEFLRRFLQHILPKGFMKIRYYGFMSSNPSKPLAVIRGLIELSLGFEVKTVENKMEPAKSLRCQNCGGELKYRFSIFPHQMGYMDMQIDTG